MAKITIKNTKSNNELAYKTGRNLPNTKGVDFNVVNPGATTGSKASSVKFNTMNLPIMGSNFQVSIDAGKEREFDNVSNIDAIYMENASAVINEDKGSSDSPIPPIPPTPPTPPEPVHYEFELTLVDEDWQLSPSGEGVQFNVGDTVTLTMNAPDYGIYAQSESVAIETDNLFFMNPEDSTFEVVGQTVYAPFEFTIESEKDCILLYNNSSNVNELLGTYMGQQTIEIDSSSGGLYSQTGIRFCSLNETTIENTNNILEDVGISVQESSSCIADIATESFEITNPTTSPSPKTYTIDVGDGYYYVEDWGTETATGNKVDLYIKFYTKDGINGLFGIVIKS